MKLRQEHLALAQQIADIGSWSLDFERDSLDWSVECYRIFGLEPGEPVSFDRFIEFVHPEDEQSVREQWQNALEGADYDIEHRVRVDGAVRWVRERAELSFDETGAPVEAVGVTQDITARKRREEQLEEQYDRVRDLRQRLSVLNRIMRHDLRTSVNIIKGNAGLASAKHDLEMLETIQSQADEILNIAENARLIVESSTETGTPNTVHDVSSVLQTKIAKLRHEHPSVSIDSSLPEERLVSAHDRLGAALEQVLRNAVEHNDTDRPKVTVSVATRSNSRVEIEIADDGPGIPDGEIEPLGAEIEHALRHTSGLGLWISHWIVEQSGGDISFDDNDPRGTVVTIGLPLAQTHSKNE